MRELAIAWLRRHIFPSLSARMPHAYNMKRSQQHEETQQAGGITNTCHALCHTSLHSMVCMSVGDIFKREV